MENLSGLKVTDCNLTALVLFLSQRWLAYIADKLAVCRRAANHSQFATHINVEPVC